MKNLILIFPLFLGSLLGNAQNSVFEYGDSLELAGKIELRTYVMDAGDTYEAYMLVLTDSIKIQVSESSENFNYGEETMTLELHIDVSNPEMEKYKDKRVSVRGSLRPSENTHHLGKVCLYQVEIKYPAKK